MSKLFSPEPHRFINNQLFSGGGDGANTLALNLVGGPKFINSQLFSFFNSQLFSGGSNGADTSPVEGLSDGYGRLHVHRKGGYMDG